MRDEQIFAFVAALCILFWLLSGRREFDPRVRRWLLLAAYGVLAAGLLLALVRSISWFLGGTA